MCRFCEDHEEYYEGCTIATSIDLGLAGEMNMWVLIEPESKQLAVHVLHRGTAKQLEFRRGINYCPMCDRSLINVTE